MPGHQNNARMLMKGDFVGKVLIRANGNSSDQVIQK